MKEQLSKLFQVYASEKVPVIIQLENRNHIPVAALYMDKLKYESFSISETKTEEAYYLYVNGISIFWTYYKILETE